MNPILNKIDNDIRRKINEKTRDGKVHRKQKIEVNKNEDWIKAVINNKK